MAKEQRGTKKRGMDPVIPVPSTIDRQLPYNPEAEAGVVGAILLNPSVCDDVAVILRPEDFYSTANRRIYSHLIEMNSDGSEIDLTLLTERLRQAGEMEEIGGPAYLGELMTSVQVAANAVYYAKIVRDKAVLRDLIETSALILGSAYESEQSARDLIGMAEEKIFAIGDSRNSNNAIKMDVIMSNVFSRLDSETGGSDGIMTGYSKLDEMLGGLHPSELIILAARPSMGKTAFATNIADHIAVEERQPVLFFSLEMANLEVANRMLCARGRISGQHLRGNFLTDAERQRFIKASSELANSFLYMDDSPARTVTEIAAVARRLKRQNGLGLIIIDYLSLISPDNPNDPRQEQVSKIARRLKGLARELEVPVLCLAQLNRQTEAMKDNRPRLSHLRESGAIEQDADVVMFVHREEYYMKNDDAADENKKGVAEIIVAKQRNGPVGEVELRWIAEYTRFENPNDDQLPTDFSELDAYGSPDF